MGWTLVQCHLVFLIPVKKLARKREGTRGIACPTKLFQTITNAGLSTASCGAGDSACRPLAGSFWFGLGKLSGIAL